MRRNNLLFSVTVVFGVLYVAAALVLGTTPKANDSGAQIVAWFHDHHSNVRAWAWCLTMALLLLGVFAVLVRERLPRPYNNVFFFGMVALVAETAAQSWIWAALSWHTAALEPATARTLLDVASFWGPTLNSATVLTVAPVAVLGTRRSGGVPRWLGVVALVATVEQLIETVTIFGSRGFTAPGGPMNVMLGAGLVGVTWICLGIWASTTAP